MIDEIGIFSDGKKQIHVAGEITFSGHDIAEVLLAKAAMQAGQKILLNNLGLKEDDLSAICIAGSFGNHIDPKSAKAVGLIPKIDLEKVKSICNAAGEGAREMLLSRKIRAEAEKVANRIEYIELMSLEYGFNDIYVESMHLG